MSATGIGATGKLPFLRDPFRLELLALSGRDAQLPPHMLESLASVELCSGNSTADDDDAHDGGREVCDDVARS